jgi:outer membrane biosynthesis protein TonB
MHALLLAMPLALAAAEPSAPSFKQGILPAQPSHVVAGGEVLLEVAVEASGTVSEIRTLRATAPYTDLLRGAVKSWMFEPARNVDGVAVPARLLLGGSYRPPTALGFGPTVGDPPKDTASPSAGVPFPSSTVTASYPPLGNGPGLVLVEFSIAADGTFTAEAPERSDSPFKTAALEAARQWRFRPVSAPSLAYVVFGFRP